MSNYEYKEVDGARSYTNNLGERIFVYEDNNGVNVSITDPLGRDHGRRGPSISSGAGQEYYHFHGILHRLEDYTFRSHKIQHRDEDGKISEYYYYHHEYMGRKHCEDGLACYYKYSPLGERMDGEWYLHGIHMNGEYEAI